MRSIALSIFFVCLALVGYFMFRPESPPDLFAASDKAGHLLGFFALSLSARFAFPRLSGTWLWLTFVVFALGAESLQHWLQQSRVFGLDDAVANLMGVVLAYGTSRLAGSGATDQAQVGS